MEKRRGFSSIFQIAVNSDIIIKSLFVTLYPYMEKNIICSIISIRNTMHTHAKRDMYMVWLDTLKLIDQLISVISGRKYKSSGEPAGHPATLF